ncbi:peptide receptor GPCR [Elysia marginata]|uniref:Peptide receptor GPCR n=1 Tax=Elysia marginata TaxID=1093978 RepID=A0AAV4GX47_9GAST|nr:peptide receptor GPCR [Elysia marginata]
MEDEATNQTGNRDNQTAFEVSGPGLEILEQIMPILTAVFFSTILFIGTFGVIGNILNLLVYARLGFSETIHMSFAALAVSDLCCVINLVWTFFCVTPELLALFACHGLRVDPTQLSNFTGGWPHMAFSRTTAFLTSWISLERCLCVILPTKVKVIITRKVTRIVLTAIFIIGCCPVVLAYIDLKFKWILDPASNITTLNMYYDFEGNENIFNGLAILLYGAIYPVCSWIVVTVCTTFLIVKLRRSVKWRKANATATTTTTNTADRDFPINQRNASNRENRATKTIVMIACFVIVFSFPISANNLTALVLRKEYSPYGSLWSLFRLNSGIGMLFSEINSSANIIFYISTGSRFRSVLLQMFSSKCIKN